MIQSEKMRSKWVVWDEIRWRDEEGKTRRGRGQERGRGQGEETEGEKREGPGLFSASGQWGERKGGTVMRYRNQACQQPAGP